MKKTFPLNTPGKDPRRVAELIRNEVGKYINREKRKTLPADNDQWEFSCRVGRDASSAVVTTLRQVPTAIDEIAVSDSPAVYVEIIASPRPRPKPVVPTTDIPASIDDGSLT